MADWDFYRDRRVFITGHTGFKGAWMCAVLKALGAEVGGYALAPPTRPNLFSLSAAGQDITAVSGDIREREKVVAAVTAFQPEIVIHLAAQPLVRESYRQPAYTYETNVLGTVNILEAVRSCPAVRSVVNVTTDKVYANNEWEWGYRENEQLDGYDPYSNSKSCSELVTASYRRSFFSEAGTAAISTCRAGNVIGGGDFAADRLVPDCVRAAVRGEKINIRHQAAVRPYQHVLEPVLAYLLVAAAQYADKSVAGCYNIGPSSSDCLSAGRLATVFCRAWGGGLTWHSCPELAAPHEAGCLKLDCAHIREVLGWQPVWTAVEAVGETVGWYKAWLGQQNLKRYMARQIDAYLEGCTWIRP